MTIKEALLDLAIHRGHHAIAETDGTITRFLWNNKLVALLVNGDYQPLVNIIEARNLCECGCAKDHKLPCVPDDGRNYWITLKCDVLFA